MKKITPKSKTLRIYFYFLIFCQLLIVPKTIAQTTHIDPATGGGFETGATFALNGWTATGSATTTLNQWVCNTGATAGFSGTRAAYVTNNTAGTPPPHTYNQTSTTIVSHLYKDITVAAGNTNIYLDFQWIGQGESIYDFMKVWIVPTTFVPAYGTAITATGTAPTGRMQQGLTRYNLQATWTNATTITIPTSYAGTTFRLVFEWTNDTTGGTNPPLGIDNISLVSSAPVACVAPTNQPTALTLSSITSTSLNGSFTAASPAPSGYLVVRSTSATAPTPTNGTTYAVASTALGAGTYVVANGTSTTFTSSTLAGNTQYYYYIYSYNSACTGQPFYKATAPLSGNAITCPAVPNSVATSSSTSNGFTLGWTTPTGGSASAITYTVQVTTDAGYTANIAGSPFSIAAPTVSQVVTGLNPSTIYYYRILAGNGCNSSYVSGNVTTGCSSVTLPYTQGFNATNTTTPVTCTTEQVVSGSDYITYETSSSSPTCSSPSEGTRFIKYNSFNAPATDAGRVYTPSIITTGTSSVTVEFDWFETGSGNTALDGVQVQWSTNGSTWTNVGPLYPRYVASAPAGWVRKSLILPAGAGNQATLYVALYFDSAF